MSREPVLAYRWVLLTIVPSLLLVVAQGSGTAMASSDAAMRAAQDSSGQSHRSSSWLGQVQDDVAKQEYEMTWQERPAVDEVEASWHAPNRSQGFRTYFTAEGIRVVPRLESAPSWRWGLSLVGYGQDETTWAVPPATLEPSGHEIEYLRGSLEERYENTPAGLEQVFTLPSPPGQEERNAGQLVLRGSTPALRKPAGGVPGFEPDARWNSGDGQPSSSREWIHLDFALWGDLSPRVSADGQAIDFVTPAGAPVLRYAQLKVTDASGSMLPSWMEGFAGGNMRGIRLVVDAREASYPITVDPMTTIAAWTADGGQTNASFGASVATAGDVNGDGYSDVIVGASLYDNGETDEGRAYVYLGSAGGLSASPAWMAESDQTNANFGHSVATAGDVNGDGYSDVIVGAFNFQNGEAGEGRAYLYLGSVSGLAPTAAWMAESDQIGAQFGWSVATAGDVNGDGYGDVIVGANLYDTDIADEGQAYLYLGSATGLATTPAWTAAGTQSAATFGTSVATAGDFNGDGYADVIVGAPGHSVNFIDFGAAYLYLGSASGPAAGPFWTGNALLHGGAFGSSVATAGDTNGDGYADILVGDPEYSGALTSRGAVVLYRGSASDPPLQWKVLQGGNANDHFGISVSTAGDVNGDGHADILVGQDDPATALREQVRIYLGSATGPATTADWVVVGSGGFGNSVAAAGDVNGDGYSDVVVGASLYDNGQPGEGRAFLYPGSASGPGPTPSWTKPGDQTDSAFGFSVSTAGDIDGDGYSDVLVGAPLYDNGQADEGKAFLYLGSGSGLPSTPAWTAEGDQQGANFGGAVATAGDVNGDGFSDVLVGAPYHDNGQSDEGRAYLYLGSASGLATTAAWTVEGDLSNAFLGWSLATAGDVNGDGFSDVMIGVPGGGEPARLFLGSAAGLATTPAWIAGSNLAGTSFGMSVAPAGDVNGDGYSDVIVGAPFFSQNTEVDEGSAYLYLGSAGGLSPSPAWTLESNQDFALYGSSVAAAGDVNGDGYSDVLVGAPFEFPMDDPGQAFLYLGSASGLATSAAWAVVGDQLNAKFGQSLATAGDVDGDGYADVIVGQPDYSTSGQPSRGRALLYLGSAAGLSPAPGWTVTGNLTDAQLGSSVAMAGDVNGDGFADTIIGAPGPGSTGSAFVYCGNGGNGLDRIPQQIRADGTALIGLLGKADSETSIRLSERGLTPAGRSMIRLEYEFKPLGTLFDGTGLAGSPVQDTGAPGGSGSVVAFDETVTGLVEGTSYHWRSRIVSSDPFFPRSPWISLAGNSMTETKLLTAGCVDRDGDGFGALSDPSCSSPVVDCNDNDSSAWAAPGETSNLRFSSGTTLEWDLPAASGADASALQYDTLRAASPDGFPSATCVESNDGPNTTATDGTNPPVGQAFYYLTRAESPCAQGAGPLGTDSSGTPRAGVQCP